MSLALLQTASLLPVQHLLNSLLALDPAAGTRLAELNGRSLIVHMQAPAFSCRLSIQAGALALGPVIEPEADTILSGRAANFLALLLSREPVSSFAPYQIEVRGSTSLLQRLQQILQELDIDWEYHLGRVFGDLPVALAGRGLKAGSSLASRNARAIAGNLVEYLQYECEWLPSKLAVEDFYQDLESLSLRLDRLEARAQKLQAA